MLSNPSQVVVRNATLLASGRWLIVNPADSAIFNQLDGDISGFHQYFDIYQQSCRSGIADKQYFGASYQAETPFDGAVLYLPKAKAHCRMLLANLATCVKPGGQILLVGENKAGIKSVAKLMADVAESINKIDSARHCSLFCGVVNDTAAVFSLDDWAEQLQVTVGQTRYPIYSLPGVFSHGELDSGTELLLNNLGKIPAGDLLDFACGAGVIGVYLGLKRPQSRITMSDISALAVHCAQQSARLNNIDARCIASNGLGEIDGKFNAIYTNPPFHTGIQTDYSVTRDFVRQIRQHLKPPGQLTLVANRFLKYPDLLGEQFKSVKAAAQTSKFTLFACQ